MLGWSSFSRSGRAILLSGSLEARSSIISGTGLRPVFRRVLDLGVCIRVQPSLRWRSPISRLPVASAASGCNWRAIAVARGAS